MSQQERKWKRKEERKCVYVCNPIIPNLIISGKAATRKFDNTRRVANIPLKTTYFAVVIYRHLISLVSISAIVKISCGQDKYLFCHNGSPDLSAWKIIARFSGSQASGMTMVLQSAATTTRKRRRRRKEVQDDERTCPMGTAQIFLLSFSRL